MLACTEPVWLLLLLMLLWTVFEGGLPTGLSRGKAESSQALNKFVLKKWYMACFALEIFHCLVPIVTVGRVAYYGLSPI